ncbi:NACHT domain- and WD repeat-containing protein 1-like isoform X1 [Acanthaster planci]|uniref:NACHT domain- and WD repeat-containing protein 1-like isoform X1 n=1 Tax=Acanthaster planci TaxID=133434 RepID=A0A8B8A2G4_ACAPL|nr:NACHT domain- and WD repeat-containing protein 1-like isoform X1 [Acanthaster planci]XP_022110605.1 NACHT domain- and WD repeat-containing protein 1-like isoform X1 [Acanthaster planci]XP_022111367.1 NACHT domain- and WD repeat-containing protein 1-like isoform X1 [Acanthaster planci]XP_022111792.1 NACHT domain- and WD repeat-containing protein 1-like isoform X1 [Acanthaster planci]XP_022111874.1 NACHT domain- and WD repeat-containing protein 1-like isoform X1 [Acanthaster planci]
MVMDAGIINGRIASLPPQPSRVVKVVLCCTKSDTEQERHALLRDAVPELQRHCQEYGLDFQLVDMYCGPGDIATNDHEMGALRLREISDAHRISQGPFFLSIIGNKYGDYVLPTRVDSTEFSHIRDCAFEAGKDINILDEWYLPEADGQEQVYTLSPISAKLKFYYDQSEENKEAHEKDVAKWKKTHDSLLEILQQCSEYVHDEGLLNEEQLHKYHMSAIENEILHAHQLSSNGGRKCLYIFRTLEDFPQNVENQEMHNYVDIRKPSRPKIYKKAQERIKFLKETKIPSLVCEENIFTYTTPWSSGGIDPKTKDEHAQYIKEMTSQIVFRIKELINEEVGKEKENARNVDNSKSILSEVMAHGQIAALQKNNFISRDSVINQVEGLVNPLKAEARKENHPIILHGEAGSGKTTVVSQLVHLAPTWLGEGVTVVARFLGRTTNCKSLRDFLESSCRQIMEAYKPKKLSDVPREGEKLAAFFMKVVTTVPSQAKPLLIVVDIPEEISQHLSKKLLEWLPSEFPASTHLVISLSDSPALKVLHEMIPNESHFIRVTSLNDRELSELVKLFLTENSRPLTSDQVKIVTRAVARHPLPMFAKLMCHEAQFVNPSGNGRDPVAALTEAANLVLQHVEERHGVTITSHILRYLTVAHHGLTEAELMDVLSCDDELLDSIYRENLPHLIRFPYHLWAAFKYDLGTLLEERFIDNKTVLTWSGSVIRQIASQRYLANSCVRANCHGRLAQLFLQGWVKEKVWSLPGRELEGVERGRKVAPQPLLYGETRYNMRRLSELWYHLAHAGDMKRLKSTTMCNFEYLLAKAHAMSVYQLLQDFDTIRGMVIDSEVDLTRSAILLSAPALMADPLQLAAELIGRLLPIKADYPGSLECLVNQAMEWCEQFTRPLIVPLASWLPTPREPYVTAVPCGGAVHKMALSDDNQVVYCVLRETFLAAFRIASHEKIWEVKGHDMEVTCIETSDDNRWLLTGSTDKTVKVWCTDKAECTGTLAEHKGVVTSILMTHGGQRVISGSADYKLRVFKSGTRALERTLEGHQDAVIAIAVNSSDDVLVSAAADSTIRTWSLETFVQLDLIEGHKCLITHMTISSDDMFIITAYEDKKLQISCLPTGSEVHCLEQHDENIVDLSNCADGTHIAVATIKHKVLVYNIKSREIVQTLTGHNGSVSKVAVTQDGHFMMTACMDGHVRVWNMPKKSNSEVSPFAHHSKVTCIALSKEGIFAITGSTDCTLRLWNLEQSQMINILCEHTKPITCVALADDASFAVSGSEDKSVRVWSAGSGVVVVCFTEHSDVISNVLITSDNKRILSADYSNHMKLWRAESGEVLLSCSGPSSMVTLTPNNDFAISGDGNELMKIWSVGSGESVKTINHVETITCLAVTRDNHFTITGSEDMSLKIWETETGKLTQILAGHDDKVSCVTLADHNRHVISGSHDKTLIIWNMGTGEIEKVLMGHTDIVTSAKMTSDGSIVVSGSHDGTVRVWAVQTGLLVTAFHMNIPVAELQMTFDASHIVVRLLEGGCVPLLCLRNSPATDIKSQSQVDIDIREAPRDPRPSEPGPEEESSSTVLPIKPKPPLVHKQTSLQIPAISRKSTSSVPDTSRPKAIVASAKARHQSYQDTTPSSGKTKKNKKSGVCLLF